MFFFSYIHLLSPYFTWWFLKNPITHFDAKNDQINKTTDTIFTHFFNNALKRFENIFILST